MGAGERGRSIDYQVAGARAILEAVAAGRAGRLVVVDGAPGTGRTTTVERLEVLARRAGLRTTVSTALPLDSSIPLGLARRLGAPLPPASSGAGELGPAELVEAAMGLLDAAVAAAGGAACVLVDDAHRADLPSLGVLVEAAQRVRDRSVVLVLAIGSDAVDPAAMQLLAELRAIPGATRIEAADLGEEEAAELVAARLDGTCPPALRDQVLRRTGGNPFLLTELVQHLGERDVGDLAELDDLTGVVPPRVRDAIAVRVGREGRAALALARAVHVLGPDATMTRASTLAGLDRRTAEDAADALVRASVLRAGPHLEVVHPLAGDALLSGLEPFARDRLLRSAAHLLVDDGLPADRAAEHLVDTAPAGEDWVVDQLRAAAARRFEAGECAAAARMLRRALEEPPTDDARAAVLRDLAIAESRTGLPEAADRIEEALATATTVGDRLLLLRERTRLVWLSGDLPEAVRASDAAVAQSTPGTELHDQLLAELLAVASMHDLSPIYARPHLVELLERARSGWVPDSAPLAAALATLVPFTVGDHRVVAPLIDRALQEDLWAVDAPPFGVRSDFVIGSLWLTDDLERATSVVAEGLERVEPDSLFRHGLLHFWLGELRYAAGDLPGAIEATTTALSPRWGPFATWSALSSATLAHTWMDQGDLRRAEEAIDAAAGRPEASRLYATGVDLARARLLLRVERPDEADRLVASVAERLGELRHRDSPQVVWRPVACRAAAALGDEDRARNVIAEEIDLARETHARGRLGRALRTAATVAPSSDDRRRLLEEAVETLSCSQRRLERALALLALGREHFARDDTAGARSVLADARELAVQCGAVAVADDALAALRATGARPRRSAQHGVDALTAAERRTVELAATGKTNREIGHLLAVAPRTVEWHLSRAFAKLGVTNRKELADALGRRR